MKKIYLFLTLLMLTLNLTAQQQYRIWQKGESTRVTIASNPTLVYTTDTDDDKPALVVGDTTYPIAEIDSIVPFHQIFVAYNGTSATVKIPAAVAADVTADIKGAYVTITNTNVANEVEFVLSGSSDDGAFTYNGSYKTTVTLNGLSLTSKQGAAIDLLCGKRIDLVLSEGTTNNLSDYAGGTQKACLFCKGHMEVKGNGTLNVTGNQTHAIKTKEYLALKKSTGTINILKAMGDAIHAGQYYQQNGGTVNVTSTTEGDAIQAELMTLDDDITVNPDKELNGQLFIKGGKINIDITHEDCKAIKADSDIAISGGTIVIKASGNGSRGIQTDGNMVVGEEEGAVTSINISASGNECANEDHSDDPHRCMGIKVDGNLTVNAGTIVVTNTGKKSRGIKVGGTYTKKGGSVSANIKN